MIRGSYKQMIDGADDWSVMVGITVPFAPWSIGKYKAEEKRNEALIKQSYSEYENMSSMIAAHVPHGTPQRVLLCKEIGQIKPDLPVILEWIGHIFSKPCD
jgi:hypothetical protein